MMCSAACSTCVYFSRSHSTGKERDPESGLDYFEARYLNSDLGRFMTPDFDDVKGGDPEPVPYADPENPQSLNLYAYVRNLVTGGIDPDGHCTFSLFNNGCTGPPPGSGPSGDPLGGGDASEAGSSGVAGFSVGGSGELADGWEGRLVASVNALESPLEAGDDHDAWDDWPIIFNLTSAQQAAIAAAAKSWFGTPYLYGGCTREGADCSGSVWAIYNLAGIRLPPQFHSSSAYANSPLFVKVTGPLQIGDVGHYPGHVVIYGGTTGPGKDVWSAFHTGGPVYGPAASSWFGTPTWYRYVGP